MMDAQGLAAALVFPTLGVGVEQGLRHDPEATMACLSSFNRWLEEDWGFAHHDRIFAPPMLSLADPDAAMAELGSLLERGARLVHIRPAPVPAAQGPRSLGHRAHDPVWSAIAEANVPVASHLGDSGYLSYAAAWGGKPDRVCLRFPELKLCMIHGADPWWDTAIRLMIKYPNLHLMTSAWAPEYLPQSLLHFMRTRGKEKVIFASDAPVLSITRTVGEAVKLDLPPEVMGNYLYANAQRFFFDRLATRPPRSGGIWEGRS